MRHYLRVAGPAVLLLAVMALPVLAQDVGNQDTPGPWLPPAASDYSPKIDFLYNAIFWATTAMFLLTEGLLIAFCVMYRRRPGHQATYTHGNNTAELTWTIIPALMLLGIAVWQIPTWNEIKKADWKALEAKPDTTVVDVLGEQYKWNVRYPGTKKKYEAEYEATGLSNIHIPFGNTALFNLRSKDVIHSVFIPAMRVKQDTTPGLRQRLWFKPNRIPLIPIQDRSVDSRSKDGAAIKIQKTEWSTDPKDFEAGGKYFEKRIAVSAISDYAQIEGIYDVYRPGGTAKKVRVLHQGKILTGQEWDSCEYALGVFEIACAELCGMGHYTMRGILVVEPKAAYEWWIQDEAENAGEPAPAWKFWRD
jgi:cytochrome c oxidase subunit 2